MRLTTTGSLRAALSIAALVLASLAWAAEPASPPSVAVLDSAKLKPPMAATLTKQLQDAAKADQERAKPARADLEKRASALTKELGGKGLTAALKATLTREQQVVKGQLAALDKALLEAAQERQAAASAQLQDSIRQAVAAVAPGALVLDRAAASSMIWQLPSSVRDITAEVQARLEKPEPAPAK